MELKGDYVNGLLGLDLSGSEISGLLEKMRYGVEEKNGVLSVSVPAYRTDVLHPMDLVEDVAIAYGYHNFNPQDINIHLKAREDPTEKYSTLMRDAIVGLGFTEVMTLILTNKENLFTKMEFPQKDVVETENPASIEHSVCRSWLTPSLMTVLAKNKTREFPQKIFEVGDVVQSKGGNGKNVACLLSHAKTNFSEIKSIFEGLLLTFNVEFEVKPSTHPSFLAGRCAETGFGFFGEIHPKVIENFGLEMPVTGFELRLEKIFPGI
ncbi:MAG: hypothetical protein ABH851_06495 [Methanobacteriota archaeon]